MQEIFGIFKGFLGVPSCNFVAKKAKTGTGKKNLMFILNNHSDYYISSVVDPDDQTIASRFKKIIPQIKHLDLKLLRALNF